jgi:two-component system, chemotaxis family, CheB/CheR fusion protein
MMHQGEALSEWNASAMASGSAAALSPTGTQALNQDTWVRLQRGPAQQPAGTADRRRTDGRRLHERVLTQALDHAGALIALLDPEGRIAYFNAGCERASGLSAHEAAGRVFWSCPFLHAGENASVERALREAASASRSDSAEWRWRHRDGSARVIRCATHALRSADGELGAILFAGVDVTDLKQAEDQIRDRLAQLADLHRLHIVEGLGTTIAHDLNQPLAAIVLLAESAIRRLQAAGFSAPQVIDDLDAVMTQAQRAGAITRRLREFLAGSPAPAGPLDVGRAIMGTCELLALEARACGVQILPLIAQGLPLASGDPRKLEHVLVTLLRNAVDAIRHAGGAQCRIDVHAVARADRTVQITVVDTGPGLPGDLAERVFEPFYSTKRGGLGLGLPISRALVEQLGGRLWAEPRAGAGVFHLTLPGAA